jgi:hypothetical protein
VSFSLLSIEKSVVTEFVSTWETVPSLSSGDVADSWVVLVTVGGVGISFVLMVLLSIQYDKHESKLVSSIDIETKEEQKSKTPRFFLSKIAPIDSGTSPAAKKDDIKKNEDIKLIEEALPSIFKPNSLWIKFKQEMRVYHRWIGIVFYYSPEFPRAMRVLSLFSSIVIMLFVQSVTYNIADPDDGSCESCNNESCCLSLKSTLNAKENRCSWEIEVGRRGVRESCQFREIDEDITRMFIVAMISAIVSAPFALSIQYLIVNVLSQEPLNSEDIEKENEKKKWMRIHKLLSRRRRSIGPETSEMADLLVESCGESPQDDLQNLLKEVSGYYKSLQIEDPTMAKEFRGTNPSFPPSSTLTCCPTLSQFHGDLLWNTQLINQDSKRFPHNFIKNS